MLWKRLKIEDIHFPTSNYKKDYLKINEVLPKEVVLEKITESKYNLLEYENIHAYRGMGDDFIHHIEENYNSGIYLNIPDKLKIINPIMIDFFMDLENPIIIDKNIIEVGSGSEATIVFDYSSNDIVTGFHNGITKILAREDSIINIVKLQRINDKSMNFDTNIAIVGRDAKVNWTSIELGGSLSGSNFSTYLENEASESNLYSIYLGDNNKKMDLSYSMIHKGMRSNSKIETRGVLMDSAQKVFRGNLDFRKGAKHSVGVEEEYVVLLDPTVKSDSIPALMCHEDDVQGEHAASAGQIDRNKLFYLMSRGLTERDSKKLIIESTFRPIIDRIPLEELRKMINSEISRRLSYE